jgi:hypothetical protein
MSMITEFVRLRPHELTELRRLLIEKPDDAYEYAGDLGMGDDDQDDDAQASRGMDTDKAWAGLQYLLAKLYPPVDVIGGGEPLTDDEWGYDSPRLLTVAEVAEAARFLDATSFAVLAGQYDPAAMTSAEIYPQMWDEEWALQYLEDNYTPLVALFRAAAADGEPVLVWMS